MAAVGRPSCWDELPDEVLLQILYHSDVRSICNLQRVSRRLRNVCLDNELWRWKCFEKTAWKSSSKRRRLCHLTAAKSTTRAGEPSHYTASFYCPYAQPFLLGCRRPSTRKMASWDPTYPGERVSWYDEFIQRHGIARVSWLQGPRRRDDDRDSHVDARGLGLYHPYGGSDGVGTKLAVSPLDDGSVCLWDVNSTRGKQGSIVARSQPGLLLPDEPCSPKARELRSIDGGVAECVSVDSDGQRAFFAVQSSLIEVDLNRLGVVGSRCLPCSISSLSAASPDTPLTVGTSRGIHFHDRRERRNPVSRLYDSARCSWGEQDDAGSVDPQPWGRYASLPQRWTPISILHLPQSGTLGRVTNDIYVAGRFPGILHFDRRKLFETVHSLYSGAYIKSLAALPHAFNPDDTKLRMRGELTLAQAQGCREAGEGGHTLIAGGEYKTKGSLELYALHESWNGSPRRKNSVFRNRHAAASATILSVVNHGTKMVFSDGAGRVKWFERDGMNECRLLQIGRSGADEPSSLFPSAPASDDLARKLVSTASPDGQDPPNDDNILFWTGEKLGMVGFKKTVQHDAEDADAERDLSATERQQRRLYTERMRRALEREADEARFLGCLGVPAELA